MGRAKASPGSRFPRLAPATANPAKWSIFVNHGVARCRLSSGRTAVEPTPMRVLFVEDSEINRRVFREMLGAGGIDMAEAEDGAMGLEMIDAQSFDLVLMDLRMPGMDGLTAIRHIRARGD